MLVETSSQTHVVRQVALLVVKQRDFHVVELSCVCETDTPFDYEKVPQSFLQVDLQENLCQIDCILYLIDSSSLFQFLLRQVPNHML